ncbi:hypothetical protein J3E68DRAFT_402052 [Trichoderma sp. SZMC 28012]
MAGQKEEREGEKKKKKMKKFGESKGGTSEVTPLRSISSFSFRSRLGFAFAVPGIIALLGMCAQCSFCRRDCRPGVPDAFCWGRVIPDEDGAEGAGTQGVLPDCFGCWVLQAVYGTAFLLGFFLPFLSFFRNCVGCGGTVRGDMGTRIWEYGIFGVPRGWYCIMTMGFTCAFP